MQKPEVSLRATFISSILGGLGIAIPSASLLTLLDLLHKLSYPSAWTATRDGILLISPISSNSLNPFHIPKNAVPLPTGTNIYLGIPICSYISKAIVLVPSRK
ncbi:102aa long hypothetical protein [Pyrococcus horikoshii OT3]|uniref:Uncharacterized protein n=1 Tax=Pyrococcus horikoshii (strain ATCC 700860 / DSM 12428 / JCM 9974 / NBRC 100139 / OT-3) TaxID=70601 RepID=O59294_PYRHO|nr:102aa long hypothetical protein [Pyrococcus horikoshii OT3]